jgi:Zn-dependent protease with chaperone function
MTTPYVLRLLCVSLAAFFLVHLALGLAVSLLSPAAIRIAGRMKPRLAALFLLSLRLFPAGFAVFLLAALCIPSFCWLEPELETEYVGWPCLAAASLGLGICAIALARVCRAAGASSRYLRRCRCTPRTTRLAGASPDVWFIEAPVPILALAGIFRPRLLVSKSVVSALSPDEFGAALQHERAHRRSRDNAKRLAMLLSPGLLPFFNGFGAIERAWARFTEWAADDRAVAGNSLRSLSLAAALVRVSRLGALPPSGLMGSFIAGGPDLSVRVDRLLRNAPACEPPERRTLAVLAAALLVAGFLAVMLQPATLTSVYDLLEHLVQ